MVCLAALVGVLMLRVCFFITTADATYSLLSSYAGENSEAPRISVTRRTGLSVGLWDTIFCDPTIILR